ncbi:hypothetical protein Sango_1903200 [Sesamum angolense]|uniref:Uncharacterized protein n=1 Tax=Sesamum angolense TaxID=2727404 RepID=A0AAE2BQS1_9LAMI|nr:hypothetical protein Sango_1903200 [Sesamum angolense]
MEKEVRQCGKVLSLTEDEESGVIMPDRLWQVELEHYLLCLVGHLLTNWSVGFDAMWTSVQGMINPVKGLEIHQLEGDMFLQRFNHIIGWNPALEGCPWSFEKKILILSGIHNEENPMRPDIYEFFVHVHDLQLSINLGLATLVGKCIGRFPDMEMDESGCSWWSYCESWMLELIGKYYEFQIADDFVDSGINSPYGP